MTDPAKVIVDGRELAHRHPMTAQMVQDGEVERGKRRWLPDLRPPNHLEWNWLGQATTGEHLYWAPVPVIAAAECAGCMSDCVTEVECVCRRHGAHLHLRCKECGYLWTERRPASDPSESTP